MKFEPSQLLRITCTFVVAGVFVAAGVSKVLSEADDQTMVARFMQSPQAVKAVGFAEIGLAMWMVSFHLPKLAQTVAIGLLVTFTVLIAVELGRENPRPCGCLEARPGLEDPHAVRRGLYVSIARNGVLIGMSAGAIVLALPVNPRRN
jgi:hypothetical protein